MGATSTTDLEPLSDHGAPPRVRRIAAAHVAPPRGSRHFSARREYVKYAFLNPISHMHKLISYFYLPDAFSFLHDPMGSDGLVSLNGL